MSQDKLASARVGSLCGGYASVPPWRVFVFDEAGGFRAEVRPGGCCRTALRGQSRPHWLCRQSDEALEGDMEPGTPAISLQGSKTPKAAAVARLRCGWLRW